MIFPGNIRIKKIATIKPTLWRRWLKIKVMMIRQIPRVISTRPDATTTKSALSGNQVGTWARNSVRFEPRWEIPAEVRNAPSAIDAIRFTTNIGTIKPYKWAVLPKTWLYLK